MICVVCQKRQADRPQVDEGCRRRVADNLRELVDAYAVLGHHDPVSMDAGPVRGQTGSAPVSGSREAPVPVSLDEVDLTLPANQGSRAPHARAVLGLGDPSGLWEADDQTGYLSVATELDTWVRDWITYSWCPGDHLPVPTVVTLADWLGKRLDVACDRHEGIDDFAGDIYRLLRQCQRIVGERSDLKRIGECPEEFDDGSTCGNALYVHPYTDVIECRRCGRRWDRRKQEWLWLGQLLGYDQDAA